MKKKAALFACVSSLFIISSASAEDPAMNGQRASMIRPDTKEDTTLAKAREIYQSVLNDTHGKVPRSVLQNAKCVAIFPKVITAAIGVGGMQGDGVAFCKNSASTTAKWGNPIFLDLTGGSVGVQAGVKSQDLVLYMTGDKARASLEAGSFKLAGELSAVAGQYDSAFIAPPSGVVAYSQTEGVFAGASVDGVSISRDDAAERDFYGTYYNPKLVFGEGMLPADKKIVNELRAILPD